MKKLHNVFQKKNNKIDNKETRNNNYDKYYEIGKLLKEARIKNNFSLKELSDLSKIPESSINAIENNIQALRPKYPFIRSILLKLEKSLSLEINTLLGLVNEEKNSYKKEKKDYIIRKFDFLNSWYGTVFYFLFLILTLFIINRYFISKRSIINIEIIEEKVIDK